jgi:hypothetical protein
VMVRQRGQSGIEEPHTAARHDNRDVAGRRHAHEMRPSRVVRDADDARNSADLLLASRTASHACSMPNFGAALRTGTTERSICFFGRMLREMDAVCAERLIRDPTEADSPRKSSCVKT